MMEPSRGVKPISDRETQRTRARYARIAPLYDILETLPEARFRSWRGRFWGGIADVLSPGARVLEVGVGTGKNLPYWPKGVSMTAVDLTPGMLSRARVRAASLGLEAEILEGDVQALEFLEGSFDLAVATFVFCSVPDPVRGLRELGRVVRPGGPIWLMEHVRSQDPRVGRLMDLLNPLVVRLMGFNINRDTVGNVTRAGLHLDRVEDLGVGGIFKIIRARAGMSDGGG